MRNSYRSFKKPEDPLTSTHKHQIISIPYPSHKCLPEKSCLEGLRILTGFDLTTRDSYFTILVEVLTNHVLAKTHTSRII